MRNTNDNPFLVWAVSGAITFLVYGTFALFFFAFRQPLTEVPFARSWLTIFVNATAFAVIGALLGLAGCNHSESYRCETRMTGVPYAGLFLVVWGAVGSAVVHALIWLMPKIEGLPPAALSDRAWAAGVGGAFAGFFLRWLRRK